MHIILAVLGVVVTILILLNRLSQNGIDIGWLNPFSWHRRRKYRLNHDLNPVFKLDSPLDVAALYLVGVAKVDGDLSATQKTALLTVFEQEFHLSAQDARALLGSSVHLIGNGQTFFSTPGRAAERVYEKLSPEQVGSINSLLHQIATTDGDASDAQMQFISAVSKALPATIKPKW